MRNLIILLTLVLILATMGCAKQKRSVDAEVESYVQSFEKIWGNTISFRVEMADIDKKWAGVCYSYGDGTRLVQLSSTYWPQMGDKAKEETVFHELGHCALNRGHRNDLNAMGQENSIMYYVVFGDNWYYSFFRDTYIQELFSGNTSNDLTNGLVEDEDDFIHSGHK